MYYENVGICTLKEFIDYCKKDLVINFAEE